MMEQKMPNITRFFLLKFLDNMKYMYSFLILSFCFDLLAQVNPPECATEDMDTTLFYTQPWINNGSYLTSTLQTQGYPLVSNPNARVESSDAVKYRIPINFIIYRDDAGNGGPSVTDLQLLVDRLNNDHLTNNTGIRFYQLCDPTFVNSSSRLDMTRFGTWWSGNTAAEAVHTNFLNIHVLRSLESGAPGTYNPFAKSSVFINRAVYSNSIAAVSLTHEVGHYLELQHTHQYQAWRGFPNENCLVEPVDRNRRFADINFCEPWFLNTRKCDKTGDGLCDTPADPRLDDGETTGCTWTRDLNDTYGDSYLHPPSGSQSPNPGNIMSYGDRDCREQFSQEQIGVMVHSIENGNHKSYKSNWKNSNVLFDTFEPDNTFTTARPFTINQDQHHSFHTAFNGSFCDEDWVRFEPTVTTSYKIQTKAANGQTTPDTEVFIYRLVANTLTLVGQNNDISASNKLSNIDINLDENTQYRIQIIQSNTASPRSQYILQVSNGCYNHDNSNYSISGNSTLCSSNTNYTVQNSVVDANVIWNVDSKISVVSGQGTRSIVAKAASASVSQSNIVAMVTQAGCEG